MENLNFKRRSSVLVALWLSCFAAVGCSANMLSESAQRDTPAAVIFEAKKLMNEQRYAEAIAHIETLGATDLARRDVTTLRASAYAGRCGLNFINLVTGIQDVSASDSLMEVVLLSMKSATSYADCKTAEDLVESMGSTPATRSTDENLLLAFISFAKIGAILAVAADADDDGIANAGFDACTGLDDTQAGEIGTGLSLAVNSLSGIDGVADVVSGDLGTICGAVPVCNITDPTAYSALELFAIRALVQDDGSLGLGTRANAACP